MNWEALGALAELLGALAVVVSLVYLALQIRRSNVLAVAESLRYSTQSSAPTILAVAQHGDLASLFRRGLVDRAALDPDERVRFDMFLGVFVGGIAGSISDQTTLGIYGDEQAPDQRSNLRLFLATPGGSAWWEAYRGNYPKPFQRFVANEILGPRPPDAGSGLAANPSHGA